MAPRGEIPEVCESLVLMPSVSLSPPLELHLNSSFSGVRDLAPHLSRVGFRSDPIPSA